MVFYAGACHLPVAPGCEKLAGPVSEDGRLLTIGIMTEDPDSASVDLDRLGKSMFSAAYTEWALSPPRSCKMVPREGVEKIDEVWSVRSEGMDYGEWYSPGREPFLWVTYYGEAGKRDFFVTANETGTSLGAAAAITLRVFADTYGERFEKELRGAGLERLLEAELTIP